MTMAEGEQDTLFEGIAFTIIPSDKINVERVRLILSRVCFAIADY